ncbi:MAG: protein kinase [Deltaproteobacteria bacterium]|nr:protein kinase [Deltaproteobacteria bacterium]
MRSCPRCGSVYNGQVEFCGLDGVKLVESESDPLIGATIDRYVIVDRLGSGGMACVYRATHQALGKDFAIKVLFGEMAADRAVAERFRREAQSAGKIDHPNIVQVIDYGTTPEGLTYMVMEMLHGRSLARAIADDGPFEPDRIIDVTHQIATGLSAAHEKGFVHRDMKPGNVMLVPIEGGKELAKVLDFGLVRVVNQNSGADSGRLTKTGHAMGTPYYMAPEQIRGEEVTAQSDLYALGAVMYEMISGKPPFVGSLTEVLVKHATERPDPLPPFGGLDVLTLRMLEKVPSDRPESAQDVLRQLEELAGIAPGAMPNPRHTTSGIPRISRPKLEAVTSSRPQRLDGPPTFGDRANLQEAMSMDSLAAVAPWWRGRLVVGGALLTSAILVGVAAAFLKTPEATVVELPVEAFDAGLAVVAPLPPPPPAASVDSGFVAEVTPPVDPKEPELKPPPKKDPEKKDPPPAAKGAPKKDPERKDPPPERREDLRGELSNLDRQIREALQRAGVSREEACGLKPAAEPCRALEKAKAQSNDVAAVEAAKKLLEAIPNLEIDREFVDKKIESAVGTLSRLRDYKLLSDTQVNAFDAKILDLRSSLMSADSHELLRIANKAATLETQMHAASRGNK